MSFKAQPKIWNPNAAALWSIILSPAFGAYLHALNADNLGRSNEAKANRSWFKIYICYLGFNLLSIFLPVINDYMSKSYGVPVALFFGWYFTLGRKQEKHIKDTYQNDYQKKSWKKPLLIAFISMLGYFGVCILFGIIAVSFFGMK